MRRNKKDLYRESGFTLIELLVVIAIIGILASVVLSSLGSARNKGANASIKSNLNSVRDQAEISYADNAWEYDNVCSDAIVVRALAAAHKASGASGSVVSTLATGQTSSTSNCHADSNNYAVSVPLKQAEGSYIYWCVDSKGFSAGRASVLGASSTSCPTS